MTVRKKKVSSNRLEHVWAEGVTVVMQVGLTMVGCIAFCFFIGRYLDRWLGLKGVMLTVFTVLGVIGGAVTAYRQIMEMNRDKRPQPNEQKPNGQL